MSSISRFVAALVLVLVAGGLAGLSARGKPQPPPADAPTSAALEALDAGSS